MRVEPSERTEEGMKDVPVASVRIPEREGVVEVVLDGMMYLLRGKRGSADEEQVS